MYLPQDLVGVFLNYWIYAFICFSGAVALYFFLPETAGKSLGQIQGDMEEADHIQDEKTSLPAVWWPSSSFNMDEFMWTSSNHRGNNRNAIYI